MIANFPVWGKAKPKYDAVFANNTWEQIIEACQLNQVPDTWLVFDQKEMTINSTNYLIDIIGKNHDTYAVGGTAPLTFQLHDCYGTTYAMNNMNTNLGGFGGSVMHTTHLPAIKALMPSEVQDAIKPVNKLSGIGSGSSSGVEAVSCDLFLLSEIEVFGSRTYSVPGEGSQYAYYSTGNSKIKYRSGSAQYWWERSPRSGFTTFCIVSNEGSSKIANPALPYGVSFAFCF